MMEPNKCFHGVVVLGAEREEDGNHFSSVWRCETCRARFAEVPVTTERDAAHTLQRRIAELAAQLNEVDQARSEDAKGYEKRLEDSYARNRAVTSERDEALLKAHRAAEILARTQPNAREKVWARPVAEALDILREASPSSSRWDKPRTLTFAPINPTHPK